MNDRPGAMIDEQLALSTFAADFKPPESAVVPPICKLPVNATVVTDGEEPIIGAKDYLRGWHRRTVSGQQASW